MLLGPAQGPNVGLGRGSSGNRKGTWDTIQECQKVALDDLVGVETAPWAR